MAADRPTAVSDTGIRHDEHVADALMVSLTVIMRDEFPDGDPQRLFTEQNHPIQTAFLNTSNEPLRVAIQVR